MNKKKIIIISIAALLLIAIVFGALYYLLSVLPKEREREENAAIIKAYYDNKLSSYEEENESVGDYEIEVAFLGDSLTDGYNLENYYPRFTTSNRGIGGDTTHGLLSRMECSAYELKPKAIVMLIGANNLDTMFNDYEEILLGIKENLPDTKVVLLSLTPTGGDFADRNKTAAYNNVKIEKLAKKYEFTYVDIFTPLLNTITDEIHEIYTTDGLHFSSEGYEVITEVLTPVLEVLLEKKIF